jgi:hypothetical protein
VTAEGHLIVVAARLTDSANYSCVAENIASTRTSDPAAITVYGRNEFFHRRRGALETNEKLEDPGF